MCRCIVIGLSDSHQLWFPPVVMQAIAGGRVFSGGKRHHELVASLLPADALWIDITVPVAEVVSRYADYPEVVVFASGDPLFFGIANTIRRLLPQVDMTVYPSMNSLQMLAHRLGMGYHDLHAVSLTGRPWHAFDEALLRGCRLIGCLTDRHHHPHAIWQRMSDYGYDVDYRMFVGERLGNEQEERVAAYDAQHDYQQPNCVMLVRRDDASEAAVGMGIADADFHLLDGRSRMITKMPVRLASLAAMDLHLKRSLWDVGFCTGSVSIEAKRLFPHLHVTAFEKREEGRRLMTLNARKFRTPGIEMLIGDFLDADVSPLTPPDAVFLGGYGGRMADVLQKIQGVMQPGGCIVFNSVSEASRLAFIQITGSMGMHPEVVHTIQVDNNNPITILKAL